MVKRYEVGTVDKDLTVDMLVVRACDYDALEAAIAEKENDV